MMVIYPSLVLKANSVHLICSYYAFSILRKSAFSTVMKRKPAFNTVMNRKSAFSTVMKSKLAFSNEQKICIQYSNEKQTCVQYSNEQQICIQYSNEMLFSTVIPFMIQYNNEVTFSTVIIQYNNTTFFKKIGTNLLQTLKWNLMKLSLTNHCLTYHHHLIENENCKQKIRSLNLLHSRNL